MVNESALIDAFRRRFPESRPTALARAPGRVNLIGEHVDYNDGLVLPIAIDRSVWVVAAPSNDDRITIHSAALDMTATFHTRDLNPPNPPTWDAYPKGVTAGLVAAGIDVFGANLYADSDLPLGGGLSSSAAFEVAVGRVLLALADAEMDAADLALLCRQAEHDFARVPCGIMDQFTSVMGLADHALLIDCRDRQVKYLPWRDRDVVVLIAESGERHALVEGTYATRVDECGRALEHFRDLHPGVRTFRDVSMNDIRAARITLDRPVFRRARHVVSEIQRTDDGARALGEGDFDALGRLMNESHESLRADYDVSSPRLDRLARFIRDMPDCLGARMTGAGFGGCVVALVKRAAVPAIEPAIERWYDDEKVPSPRFFTTTPGPGATTKMLTNE